MRGKGGDRQTGENRYSFSTPLYEKAVGRSLDSQHFDSYNFAAVHAAVRYGAIDLPNLASAIRRTKARTIHTLTLTLTLTLC